MKHNFTYERDKEGVVFSPAKKITLETDADDLQELFDEFKMYLQSVGFVFGPYEDLAITGAAQQEFSNYVYIVTMKRWGGDESHNYVIGVYSTFGRAEEAAELEEEYRGGKYERDVTVFKCNKVFRDYDERI